MSEIPQNRQEEMLKEAEKHKDEGNAHFKLGHFDKAVEAYTEALNSCYDQETNSQLPTNLHVYLNNRAFAHFKLENFGSCIMDCDLALKHNPTFTKAMYRKGCALMYIAKYQEAQKVFKQVLALHQDNESLLRYKECEKKVKWIKFSAAIAPEKLSKSLDLVNFPIDKDYKGFTYTLSNNSVVLPPNTTSSSLLQSLIDFLSQGNTLHKRIAYQIILDAIPIFQQYNTIVPINYYPSPDTPKKRITVCGDIHGQFFDLLKIFQENGLPSENNIYVFNGDIVDRGSYSTECLLVLLFSKILCPNSIYLARGNHETRNMNNIYGFYNECKSKYDSNFYELCCELFCCFPIVHLINEKVFITHGGLPTEDNVTLDDIRKIDRDCEPGSDGVLVDLLWNDPHENMNRLPSKRGIGTMFGKNVTKEFLERNNLEMIIRSHEMEMGGYRVTHEGMLVSLFSAPNYCDTSGNLGAYMVFEWDEKLSKLVPSYNTFTSANQSGSIPSMKYVDSSIGGGNMMQQLQLQQMLANRKQNQ